MPKRSQKVAIADYVALAPAQLHAEICWTKGMVQRLARELEAQRKAWAIQQRASKP